MLLPEQNSFFFFVLREANRKCEPKFNLCTGISVVIFADTCGEIQGAVAAKPELPFGDDAIQRRGHAEFHEPCQSFIAPKGLLRRGVWKIMLVCPCIHPCMHPCMHPCDVTKSVRGPVFDQSFVRFACNAEPSRPKTGLFRTRAVWGEKVSLI